MIDGLAENGVEAGAGGELVSEIGAGDTRGANVHFLNGDEVRIHRLNDRGDAGDVEFGISPFAVMNVVGEHPHLRLLGKTSGGEQQQKYPLGHPCRIAV